jgi:hypothetical protein
MKAEDFLGEAPSAPSAEDFLGAEPPGTLSGTWNSVKRGALAAGQSVDAVSLAMAANLSESAKQEPERVTRETAEDPKPSRDQIAKVWGEDKADRVYTIALKKWLERAAGREERLQNNRRFSEAVDSRTVPGLVASIARNQGKIDALPQTVGKEAFDRADGLGESLAAVAKHPVDSIAGIAAESIPASTPSLALGIVGSAAGPLGTAAGAGSGSFATEYASTILQELQQAGADFQKPETVAALLQDPKRLAEFQSKAVRRGVPVAVFDALSAGLAGRLLRAPAKGAVHKLAHGAAEVGIQGALGGAGEAAGSVVAGDKIDGKAVLAEILGEVGSGSVEIATGVARDRLDTGRNVPESAKTLRAQQKQLTEGRRAAQMFPAGTPEIDLPPGMQRLETERGVFHFNPAKVSADQVRALSAAGRENEILGFGPVSKPEAIARAEKTGEPLVSVTERAADGTEIKTSVATTGTAAAQAAALEAAKSPGSTVQVEPVAGVPAERRGNFVEDLLKKDAASAKSQQELIAREQLERAARQADLAEKRGRFDGRIAVARETIANPEATFAEVKGALESVKFYAEDNSLGLAQEQREQAAKAQAILSKRLDIMQAAEDAQRDQEALARRTAAEAATKEKAARVRADRERIDMIETTGRDESGKIVDLTKVPEDQLAAILPEDEGLTPEQITAEFERRAREEERAAAQSDTGLNYTLRDLFLGKKAALRDAGLRAPLRLLSPEVARREGGPGGEHAAMRERTGGFRYFADTGLAEDRLAETLRELGFDAPDTAAAYSLVERVLGGEDVRPTRAGGDEQLNRIDFAAGIYDGAENEANRQKYPFAPRQARSLYETKRAQTKAEEEISASQGEPRPLGDRLNDIEARMARGAIDRDRAARAVNRFIEITEEHKGRWPALFNRKGKHTSVEITRDEALALQRAVRAFDAGGKFVFPSEELGTRVMTYFATEARPGPVATLTDAEATREINALRSAFPALTRDYDIELGLVEGELKKRGFKGNVPEGVEAAIARLRGKRALIVLAARAWRDRAKGAALFTHELAHAFLDTLTPETRGLLRQLYEQETQDRTGPLFTDGQPNTEIAFLPEQFEPARLKTDPDLAFKEWFAERTARLNADWAQGRIDATEHSLMRRIMQQLRETLRRVWSALAERDGVDPDSELFTAAFRRFLESGADAAAGREAGTAYAAQKKAQFAQGLLALDTPAGVALPDEIRNLSPRWQDKFLRFDSSLDKALYYAGGDGQTAVRAKVIDSLSEQTGLSTGQIATLARRLREKIAPLARNTASNGTLRVPALMRQDAAALTGVEFATRPEQGPPDGGAPFLTKDQFSEASDDAIKSEHARVSKIITGKAKKLSINLRQDLYRLRVQLTEEAARRNMPSLDTAGKNAAADALVAKTIKTAGEIEREQAAAKPPAPPPEKQPAVDADKIIAEAPRVTPIPKIDRREALVSELKRGRAMRDEGDRTGNDIAEAEGRRIVRQATERLDEEFPGWEKKEKPAAPEPVVEAAAEPSEPSPFKPEETEPPLPVRKAKTDELYGHSATQPPAIARTWKRVRELIAGVRGAVPELPAFPAAKWNAADSFIRKHGAGFYNRVKEGLRTLKSGNDYIQKTAEEQVARVIRPLVEAGGKFDASDYARLRRRQEQARRLRAENRTVPAAVLAEIQALNSRMESSPYVLFNRLVLLLDLNWRQQNLKDSQGNPIRLPSGLNQAEITAELQRLGERVAASPHAALIETAVREHTALVGRIAEEMKTRELLAADHLANPYYFPHLTLEVNRGGEIEQRELTPSRVRPGTEADFRGYLVDPVGSLKPIETDYLRAMYYHLVQVGAHNFKADAVRDFFRPYDIKKQVEDRAKKLTRERGTPVSWEQAFHEEFAPEGYVLYGTDSRDAFPSITVNRDALARRLGVMLTSEDLHRQLEQLGLKGVKLLPQDLAETLQQGARETWILPARVADALRGIADRQNHTDSALEAAMKWSLGKWKQWKLFIPWNHVRYEYGNIVADLEKLFSASPSTFRQLPAAAKEIRAFWLGGEPSADLRAALKEGVINAITAQEMNQLQRLRAFEAFETRAEKVVRQVKARGSSILTQPVTNALGLGDLSSVELSAMREAITRYANFKANLEAIRNGARPYYGGAYWRDIEAIADSSPGAKDANERKAAQISKSTFGDYGDLSVMGEQVRAKFIPFYSWMEVNFKYHANLLRNLRDMVATGDLSSGKARAQAARTIGTAAAGFTARAAGAVLLRLALPYIAVAMWNNSGDREDLEKELSEEDRRRFHVILGKDDEGKVLVVYGNTALNDVTRWFSGQRFAQNMAGWMNGKTDFPTAFSAWADNLAPDLANNIAGGFGPWAKIPYTLASKKSTFPDVTDQRTVPAYDMRRNILAQMTDDFTADQVEKIVSKDYYASKDTGDWAKQLILQVRQRDPEAWAFYEIKDKASGFVEQRTGQKRDSSYDAPDQQVLRNFRRAIYRGDVEAATQFYLRLLDYGYTAERFKASIRAQDPLSAVPKELRREFVDGLDTRDRAQLSRAYEFYQRMQGAQGREKALFPSERWGERGAQLYRAQPRVDLVRQQVEGSGQMTSEELTEKADRALRDSLKNSR